MGNTIVDDARFKTIMTNPAQKVVVHNDSPDIPSIKDAPATLECLVDDSNHQGALDIECLEPIGYKSAGKILTKYLGVMRSNKCIDCHEILSLKELRLLSGAIGDVQTEKLRDWLHSYMIDNVTKRTQERKEALSQGKAKTAKINTILNSSESSNSLMDTSVKIDAAAEVPAQVQKAPPSKKKSNTSQVISQKKQKGENSSKKKIEVSQKKKKTDKPTPVVLTNKVYSDANICFVNEDALKRDFNDNREEPDGDEEVMSVVGIGRIKNKGSKKGSRSPGQLKFLVSWVGYSAKHNSFETEKNLLALSKTPKKHSE